MALGKCWPLVSGSAPCGQEPSTHLCGHRALHPSLIHISCKQPPFGQTLRKRPAQVLKVGVGMIGQRFLGFQVPEMWSKWWGGQCRLGVVTCSRSCRLFILWRGVHLEKGESEALLQSRVLSGWGAGPITLDLHLHQDLQSFDPHFFSDHEPIA